MRALGVWGDAAATETILAVIGPRPATAPDSRIMISAGIRSLGRLRAEAGLQALIALLDDPFWARRAAEALGDFGERRAVQPLIAAYPRYAKQLQDQDPPDVPRDDKMGFPSEDRMLETPYWIAYALCRLPLDDPRDRAALRAIGPQLMANLPGDHDTFLLYEPEVGHLVTRHLLDRAGLTQEACEQAFTQLGQPRRVPPPDDAGQLLWSQFPPRRIASWLPCVCTDPADLPRLVAAVGTSERLGASRTRPRPWPGWVTRGRLNRSPRFWPARNPRRISVTAGRSRTKSTTIRRRVGGRASSGHLGCSGPTSISA